MFTKQKNTRSFSVRRLGSLSPRLLFRLGSGVCVKYAIRFYDLPTTIARFWSSRSSIRGGGTLSIGSQTIHLISLRTISTDYLWENRSESTKIGRANSTTGLFYSPTTTGNL